MYYNFFSPHICSYCFFDELLFYVCDVGYVIATCIAKRPFKYTNRRQGLMFHEFTQSWVEYELVKVSGAFGLQSISLHTRLKQWSPDLFDVFTYLQNKSSLSKMGQKNAIRTIDILFTKTMYNGHFVKVQYGRRRNYVATQSFKLSLIVLTWLHQLEQFFLPPKIANLEEGDWNNYGKYCGTFLNPMAKKAPLAIINFSKNCYPKIRRSLPRFLNSNRKKEKSESVYLWRNGHYSFWNLRLSMPTTKMRKVKRITKEKTRKLDTRPTFFISNLDFSKKGGRGQDKSAGAYLNTNTDRFNNMPKNELALNFSIFLWGGKTRCTLIATLM